MLELLDQQQSLTTNQWKTFTASIEELDAALTRPKPLAAQPEPGGS